MTRCSVLSSPVFLPQASPNPTPYLSMSSLFFLESRPSPNPDFVRQKTTQLRDPGGLRVSIPSGSSWRSQREGLRQSHIGSTWPSSRIASLHQVITATERVPKSIINDHRRWKGSMIGGHHGEFGARAYNGGLGAEPPAGSRGRARGQGVRVRSPLKLKAFWSLDVQQSRQI